MIGNIKIQCFCCHKQLNLLSVEPEFYCCICVRQKEIHNSENNVNPIKWYSKISNEITLTQIKITKQINKINDLNEENIKTTQAKIFQTKKFQIENLKSLVEKLKLNKDNKLNLKNAIRLSQETMGKDFKSVISQSSFTIKRVDELSINQKELKEKILTIQSYLNKLQILFIEEIFRVFPITLCKYEPDKICNLPLHIELSDSSVLESNDSTASAILLLTILATSITFILDICYSSMDIKQFTFQTICRQTEPLKRDEIMCVYRFLTRIVHHITQSTLFRIDMDKPSLAKVIPIDRLTLASNNELNADNYPLKKLVFLRDNLQTALLNQGISNPYILLLSNVFQNEYINDFSICSRINNSVKELDLMDFVELSSIIPLNELPSIYRVQETSDNQMIPEWFSWMKKGFPNKM